MLPDEALNALLSTKQLLKEDLPRRVFIDVPQERRNCFPATDADGRQSFYRLTTTASDKKQAIPVVKMQTKAGPYSSSRLLVHLLDGTELLERLRQSIAEGEEYVTVARNVALALKQDFCLDLIDDDHCVMLIRGMANALDQAAKRSGFRPEFRVIGEYVMGNASCALGSFQQCNIACLDVRLTFVFLLRQWI